MSQPRQYTADASLVLDSRPDPIMGNMVGGANMATQVETLKSDRVAARVVEMLDLQKSADLVLMWQKTAADKMPIDRFLANMLQTGLVAEPLRGSNIITVSFTSENGRFAADAANAFAKAAMDISVELKVEPAKQSADWFTAQTKGLRTNLENAQARLSKFQQENGIVASDEKVDRENARVAALEAQLILAQSDRIDASARQRTTGTDASPDVQQNPMIQGLKSQLLTAELKLNEISSVQGENNPQRRQLELMVTGLKQQIDTEIRRLSGTTAAASRASTQKVEELKAMLEAQKRQTLSLRSQRDQMALLVKDVESAQRAFEGASQRVNQLTLESQSNNANVRMLSPAVEPLYPNKRKALFGVVGSLIGAFALGCGAAIAWGMLDRRVRGIEDLAMIEAVPVIGVLQPAGSRRAVFRKIAAPRMVKQPTFVPLQGGRR